jgi:catechol 2,3-dioxygenase-like lactoylglutathione lyase family enzyme
MAAPAPPAIAQQVVFLDTRDLRRAADFYERVIGLRLARDQGNVRIYHVCGSAYVGFCQNDDAPQPAPRVVLTLVTDQVDEWFDRLRQHGVEIVKEPADNPPYRIYNGFARDPSGYLLEIQRFWEPLE